MLTIFSVAADGRAKPYDPFWVEIGNEQGLTDSLLQVYYRIMISAVNSLSHLNEQGLTDSLLQDVLAVSGAMQVYRYKDPSLCVNPLSYPCCSPRNLIVQAKAKALSLPFNLSFAIGGKHLNTCCSCR